MNNGLAPDVGLKHEYTKIKQGDEIVAKVNLTQAFHNSENEFKKYDNQILAKDPIFSKYISGVFDAQTGEFLYQK